MVLSDGEEGKEEEEKEKEKEEKKRLYQRNAHLSFSRAHRLCQGVVLTSRRPQLAQSTTQQPGEYKTKQNKRRKLKMGKKPDDRPNDTTDRKITNKNIKRTGKEKKKEEAVSFRESYNYSAIAYPDDAEIFVREWVSEGDIIGETKTKKKKKGKKYLGKRRKARKG